MPIHVALDARYIREKPSGIGNYVRALVDRLAGLAPQDRFTFWAHPRAPRPLSAARNARDIVVRPGPNSPLTICWPQRFADFCGVDVFHGPQNVLPRNLPCASVVTVHDLMALEAPHHFLKGAERLVRRFYYPQAVWRALKQATRIITPSTATADRIVAHLPSAAKRIRVIKQGVEPRFRPAGDVTVARARVAGLIGGEWPYLLVIGANTAAKRHDVALAAFASAAAAPWRLVLLQRRLQDGQLVRIAQRLGVAERTIFIEQVASDDVVALLQCATALLQPSVYEGFGLPVLEAMACGCPVVATDIPPFREVAGDAAAFTAVDNVEQFAAAVREVLRSAELRATMSQRGLAQAKKFSWDRCASETLEVYHEAAGTR